MVEMTVEYQGDLHCQATHGPSGTSIVTDAPVDNQGRGQAFSPTDLLAAALGSCLLTIMGIVAQRHQMDLRSAKARVTKWMTQSPPRRIERLQVDLDIPNVADEKMRQMLQNAAKACPVHHSLHPDIQIDLHFNWL